MYTFDLPGLEPIAFVHKRLIRGVKGFVTGGFQGAAIGLLTPDRREQKLQQATQRQVQKSPLRPIPRSEGFTRPPRLTRPEVPRLIVPPAVTAAQISAGRVQTDQMSNTELFRLVRGSFPLAQKRAAAATLRSRGDDPNTPRTVAHRLFRPEPPAFSAPAPSTKCIWPSRIDPNTGRCRIFLGDQPGRDDPVATDDFGMAVRGAFGMPAIEPAVEMRQHRSCPTGMVLGRDGLCYPKAVLRRDSKFREWRPGMRPILTGGERRGITKARRSINKAREAVGLQALK